MDDTRRVLTYAECRQSPYARKAWRCNRLCPRRRVAHDRLVGALLEGEGRMKKRILLMLVVCLVAVLSVLSQPVYAQDQGHVHVSGTLNYKFKLLAKGESSGNTFMDGTEDE